MAQPVATTRGDAIGEEDPRYTEFKDNFARSEARLAALFDPRRSIQAPSRPDEDKREAHGEVNAVEVSQPTIAPPRKAARTIDEDDYGDDDEEEDEDLGTASPLQSKGAGAARIVNGTTPQGLLVPSLPKRPSNDRRSTASSTEQLKSPGDMRKKLEEDKKAAEDAARKSFHTLFYTLESDRDAMLEQQKLDDLDRQVESEMLGQPTSNTSAATVAGPQQGTLSSANLGASSLTLKHLIARIDAKRHMVNASDAQLRNLMSEVRKNRSKWASEDKVNQEELYESCEKVLMELKAMTEHAAPFLQRVNKREAPDYYNVIKHPMDIGTMLKKLKQLQYKSKKEFVDDLNLIWANCLKYNVDPQHFLRKKALYMRKETEKLVPLIPELVVRDRAEVEAEERRMQNGDLEGVEDSDDEEPIMASRGRKAPAKKGKKPSSTARKAPGARLEGTPGAESKPPLPSIRGSTSTLNNEFFRADSDAPMEGSQNGLATPPPGTLTPLGRHGIFSSGAHGSQADVSEIDATGESVSGVTTSQAEDLDLDDIEYRTWKQVTKKDRATVAAERNRLFRNNRLNAEEPALLRTKAGMRRWLRQRNQATEEGKAEGPAPAKDGREGVQSTRGETLAEGIEKEEERNLPDYYDPLSAIPDLDDRLKWVEDADGQVIYQAEEFLRMVPKGQFTAPESVLTRKMDANMRQMQETRKVCAKIGIVKQMQLQSQTYQNQFQKYEPQPFREADVEPLVISDEGPIMSQWVCRAALQRSVGKIFYHAGFEEFQPSALDAITDIAGTFFKNLVQTLGVYSAMPKIKTEQATPISEKAALKPRFTAEEAILHSLHENGVDLEALESYVKDDVDRLGSKLSVMHDRMRSHLAELLRPALNADAGTDGVGAFNDGSEQFVGGDFAEDIDEDFFGFKELGLDKEFGLASLSVPFHLLQNRMHNAYRAQNTSATETSGVIFEPPPPYEPVTIENVSSQIGLVQPFFLRKLHANGDLPLIEDEELPPKQRFPRPRLPPSGKITSPRKRPQKELQQMAKKKRKLDDGTAKDDSATPNVGKLKPIGKLRLEMPQKEGSQPEPEKDDGSAVGMISPESISAAA
ncbi:Transcriptional activator spt7 [Coniosporium tulheliwenetii]|uniref:Transcriptional activator spt7 n=1 Tax=Coniosporium tulheliwenetii TaxID=3383036 RepID=A0ACC2ZI42_9PEZI|nr:Transcriptional activator spt7 [Cladosporium sp. JES 115]